MRSPSARVAVFTLGLSSLVYGLIHASEHGWTDGAVVACFAVAGVLLAAFPFVELRVRQPVFDLALFRKPTFVGGLVAAFGMNGSLFAMFLYLVLYLQDVLGYSALETGCGSWWSAARRSSPTSLRDRCRRACRHGSWSGPGSCWSARACS